MGKFTNVQRQAIRRMLGRIDEVSANAWIDYLEELDLNPFIGEAIPMGNSVYVTNKGLLKLLQKSGRYDGHEYEWGFDDKGNLLYVDVKLYLKDIRHPIVERAWLRDYVHLINRQKGSMAWKTSTYDMLAVKAMNKAIRRGLGLQITSAEEIADEETIKSLISQIAEAMNAAKSAEEFSEENQSQKASNNRNEDYVVLILRWLTELSAQYDKKLLQQIYKETMEKFGLTTIETQAQYEAVVNEIIRRLNNVGGEK